MEVPLITDFTYYENAVASFKVFYAVHKEDKRMWRFWGAPLYSWYLETRQYIRKDLYPDTTKLPYMRKDLWPDITKLEPLSPLSILVTIGFCPESAEDIEHQIKYVDSVIEGIKARTKELECDTNLSAVFKKKEVSWRQAEISRWQEERNRLEEQLAEINKG